MAGGSLSIDPDDEPAFDHSPGRQPSVGSDLTRPRNRTPLGIIFNPRAFGSRALRRSGLEEGLREHRLAFEIIEANGSDAAKEAAAKVAREGAVAVAAGGDGTAQAVANGLLGSGVPDPIMGLLPLGVGNDLARSLGRLSQGLKPALEALAGNRISRIDVGRVNGSEFFLNALGVGFDAEVVRRRSLQRIRLPDYLPTVLSTILRYKPQFYRLRWPGGLFDGQTLMLTAMNGTWEGGGFKLAPKANLQDGLLDFIRIDPIGRWDFARYLMAVRWGMHSRTSKMQQWQADQLTVESDTQMQYHVDGEYREAEVGESLTIEVERQRLQLIT